ncbi:ABC transporter permease [Chloroflexota bacterium]
MRNYIIRRVLLMIPTVWLASTLVFVGMRLIPGSIVDKIVAQLAEFGPVDREEIAEMMGLSGPIYVQYGRWLGVMPNMDGEFSGLAQGNFGVSLLKSVPVAENILERWPVTLELGLLGLIMGQIISIPVGVFSALRQDTRDDYIARSVAILFMAVPSFWLSTMVIVFPSIWWGYMPPIELVALTEDPIGNLQMFLLPAACLGLAMTGTTMRLTRTMMLEVLRQDYIRTAWAKGLRERVVIVRHALKNALIPIVSLIGLRLPVLIGGTVIVETIFGLPGIGRLVVNATSYRDYPVLSGVLLFFAVALVLINLLVDLTYGYLDPRVKYG